MEKALGGILVIAPPIAASARYGSDGVDSGRWWGGEEEERFSFINDLTRRDEVKCQTYPPHTHTPAPPKVSVSSSASRAHHDARTIS